MHASIVYLRVKVQLGVIARHQRNTNTYSHAQAYKLDRDACSSLIMCESKLTWIQCNQKLFLLLDDIF